MAWSGGFKDAVLKLAECRPAFLSSRLASQLSLLQARFQGADSIPPEWLLRLLPLDFTILIKPLKSVLVSALTVDFTQCQSGGTYLWQNAWKPTPQAANTQLAASGTLLVV